MKPISIFASERRLARHDRYAEVRRPLSTSEYFFRPGSDAPVGGARPLPFDRARHAFRRMTGEMLTKHERDEPVELFCYGLVTAIALWPLLDLLIVLAQTARG